MSEPTWKAVQVNIPTGVPSPVSPPGVLPTILDQAESRWLTDDDPHAQTLINARGDLVWLIPALRDAEQMLQELGIGLRGWKQRALAAEAALRAVSQAERREPSAEEIARVLNYAAEQMGWGPHVKPFPTVAALKVFMDERCKLWAEDAIAEAAGAVVERGEFIEPVRRAASPAGQGDRT